MKNERPTSNTQRPTSNVRHGIIGLVSALALSICAPLFAAPPPLFPFDNGLTDIKSVEEQAALLKELGYSGICTRPGKTTPEFFAAMDKHGLEVCASYIVLGAGKGANIPANVVQHLKDLKGRNTVVWLGLSGKAPNDEPAIAALKKVGDLAQANGLTVALYPHTGFYAATVKSCLRLVEKAKHPNVGVSFCLCHFLKQNPHTELEATLRSAAPHLKVVQISGADCKESGGKRWSDLIKPLGEGNFDLMRVIKTLNEIGYDGPMNLQCYGITQPARKHLKASMDAWKKYHEE